MTSRPFSTCTARAGFSIFFGASLAARFPLPLPEIGSSISRWPSTRFFLPLALCGGDAIAAGAALRSPSAGRLFFSASTSG